MQSDPGVYAFFKGEQMGLTLEQFSEIMTGRMSDYAFAAIHLLTSEDCAPGSPMARAVYA